MKSPGFYEFVGIAFWVCRTSASTNPAMVCGSASASTVSPHSRKAALVVGPMEAT